MDLLVVSVFTPIYYIYNMYSHLPWHELICLCRFKDIQILFNKCQLNKRVLTQFNGKDIFAIIGYDKYENNPSINIYLSLMGFRFQRLSCKIWWRLICFGISGTKWWTFLVVRRRWRSFYVLIKMPWCITCK